MKLKDKVVLVTGASSGIRNEITKLLAKEGASVVMIARKNEKWDGIVNQIKTSGGEVIVVAGVADNEKDIQNAINAALDEFGKLDIVINSAGIADIIAPVVDMGEGIWEVDLSVDLTGAIQSH